MFVRHPSKSEQGNSKLVLVSASSTKSPQSKCCHKMLSRWAQYKWGGGVCERQSVAEKFWETQRWLSSDPFWKCSSPLDERLSPHCHFGERFFIERRVVSRPLMTMLWQGLIRRIASLDSAVTSLLVLQHCRSSVEVEKIKMNDEIIEGQGDDPDTTQKTKWVEWDLEVRRSIMLYTIQIQRNVVQSLMQAQIRRCLWTRGVTGRSRSRDREIKIATEVRTNAEQWSRMWKESRILQLDRWVKKLMCDQRTRASYGVVETDDKEIIVRVIQNSLQRCLRRNLLIKDKTGLSSSKEDSKMMNTIAADLVCGSDVQACRIQRRWFEWCGGRDRRRTHGRWWWWRLKTSTHDRKHCHARGVLLLGLIRLDTQTDNGRRCQLRGSTHSVLLMFFKRCWSNVTNILGEGALTNSFSRKTSILWSLIQSLNFSYWFTRAYQCSQ